MSLAIYARVLLVRNRGNQLKLASSFSQPVTMGSFVFGKFVKENKITMLRYL